MVMGIWQCSLYGLFSWCWSNQTLLVLIWTKKLCLEDHVDLAGDGFYEAEEKAGTPLTSVVAKDMVDWLEFSKSKLKPLEDDVKDAKRRISAAKGPKKRKAVPVQNASEAETSDGGGSA